MTSLIAVLLSLAMMLTGAGGEGMPQQSARTLTLRNVVVTYNGETQRLAPEAHIGAMTDGETAVFDFGVDVDGQALLPIQVGVGEKGLTALFEESGIAVNLTKEALDAAMAQSDEAMGAMIGNVDNPELMSFLTEEYLPAYVGVLKLASDKEFPASMQEKSQEILDSVIDRGEGTPDVAVIDDVSYDVLAYHYTIDAEHLGALADAVFASIPELTAYSDAMFKLYAMMPEETGLNDIHSYTEAMTKFGIDMTMDVNEQRSEDGQVQVMDGTLTMDMSNLNAMLASQMVGEQAVEEPLPVDDAEDVNDAEVAEGAEDAVEPEPTPEPIVLEPMVMNLHSVTVGDTASANLSFDYEIQGSAMEYNMDVAQDPTTTSMELTGTVSVNGEKTGRLSVSSVRAENGEDGISYGFNTGIVSKDAIQLEVNVFGDVAADGASNNTISLEGRLPEASFALSFDAEISGDDIEDKVSAVEPDVVIDDLSDEAMENLFQDQNVSAVMAKIGASLTVDAGKLFQDQSMLNASALMNGEHLPIVVEDEPAADYDYTYEIDGDDGFVIDGMEEAEDDYEMAEDDGELGFEVPELTFLPQGWSVANVEADTAYDWVGISVADENGQECMYATFFQDMDGELTNYTVNEKGAVQQGRAMSVSDYGEGGLAVTLRENGLYGSLSFASGAIDVDTLGRIVAGIQF